MRVPTQIVIVGDSITAGYGASTSAAANVPVLAQHFGTTATVSGFGHPGATMLSTSTAPFVPYVQQTDYADATKAVEAFAPTEIVDVVIMLGTNDAAPQNWVGPSGSNSARFTTEYAAMVDHFAGLASRPMVYVALSPALFIPLAGPTANSDCILHDQIIPIIRQIAMQKSLQIVDEYSATVGHPEYFVVPGTKTIDIHPNDMGHKAIAQVMYDTLTGRTPTAGDPSAEAACNGGMFLIPERRYNP